MASPEAVGIWVAVAVVMLIAEIATTALVALYIALGAAGAAIAAVFTDNVGIQLAVFGLVAVVLLVITRPVLKQRLEGPDIASNADTVVGKRGIVTIAIDNDANTGQVRIGSEYWTARVDASIEGTVIPVDARVEVVHVSGVTARVVLLPQ